MDNNEFNQIILSWKKYAELVNQDFVYHYTDIDDLIGIIQNNELWLSERNYMNDVNDEKFIEAYIKKYFNNSLNWEGSAVQRQLTPPENQFIFSTSLESDSVHNWICYGANGAFSIEFDRNKLIEFFREVSCADYFTYGKVLYTDDGIEQLLDEILNTFKELFFEKINSVVFDRDNSTQQKEFQKFYKHFYSMIKQKGHACEAEYRFLIKKEKELFFRTKNGRPVPFIKVKVEDQKLPITKILVGPYDKSDITIRSLELLLKQTGYNNIPIVQSSLNMR